MKSQIATLTILSFLICGPVADAKQKQRKHLPDLRPAAIAEIKPAPRVAPELHEKSKISLPELGRWLRDELGADQISITEYSRDLSNYNPLRLAVSLVDHEGTKDLSKTYFEVQFTFKKRGAEHKGRCQIVEDDATEVRKAHLFTPTCSFGEEKFKLPLQKDFAFKLQDYKSVALEKSLGEREDFGAKQIEQLMRVPASEPFTQSAAPR